MSNKVLSTVLKYSPHIVLSLMLAIAGGFAYKFYQDKVDAEEEVRRYTDIVGSVDEYKQLKDNLAKLETKYSNREDLHEKKKKEWANEREELKGRIKALADASYEGENEDHEVVLNDDDGMADFVTHFYDGNEFGPAVTQTELREMTIHPDGSWEMISTSRVIDHEINVKAAITKDEKTGEVNILTKAFWIQQEPSGLDNDKWFKKPYPLGVTGGSITIDPTEPVNPELINRFRWAPHLNIGVFAGATGNSSRPVGGHIDLSLWGYGKTDNDMLFKFGQVGTNISKNYIDANIIPASYNVGTAIPLISDLYVGPGIGYGTDKTTVFLSINKTL